MTVETESISTKFLLFITDSYMIWCFHKVNIAQIKFGFNQCFAAVCTKRLSLHGTANAIFSWFHEYFQKVLSSLFQPLERSRNCHWNKFSLPLFGASYHVYHPCTGQTSPYSTANCKVRIEAFMLVQLNSHPDTRRERKNNINITKKYLNTKWVARWPCIRTPYLRCLGFELR